MAANRPGWGWEARLISSKRIAGPLDFEPQCQECSGRLLAHREEDMPSLAGIIRENPGSGGVRQRRLEVGNGGTVFQAAEEIRRAHSDIGLTGASKQLA